MTSSRPLSMASSTVVFSVFPMSPFLATCEAVDDRRPASCSAAAGSTLDSGRRPARPAAEAASMQVVLVPGMRAARRPPPGRRNSREIRRGAVKLPSEAPPTRRSSRERPRRGSRDLGELNLA